MPELEFLPYPLEYTYKVDHRRHEFQGALNEIRAGSSGT